MQEIWAQVFCCCCLFSGVGVGCFVSALILLLRAQLGYRKYELEFLITSACGISNAVLLVLPGISDAICDLYDNKQEWIVNVLIPGETVTQA